MSGWDSRSVNSLRLQVIRLTTSLGRPASISSSIRRMLVMGTRLADFRTTVLPQAMARGTNQPAGIIAGKL